MVCFYLISLVTPLALTYSFLAYCYPYSFLICSGSSVGEIIGHSKAINSVDYRQERPFRIATASEDNQVNFYEGPPFKFKLSEQNHMKFVNAVRFSPNGSFFASGGADGKSFIYDGKTGEMKVQLGTPAHKGGIYAIAWSPDNKEVLTVSGDKSAKIWDAATGSLVAECSFGGTIDDMQVGCLWQGPHILSVSLSGFINYLDRNNMSVPKYIIKGHNKPIMCIAANEDRSVLFTGDQAGLLMIWNAHGGQAEPLIGKPHNNQISKIAIDGDEIISCSMDDCVRISHLSNRQWGNYDIRMESMPRAVVAKQGMIAIACMKEVVVMRGGRVTAVAKVDYDPSAISYNDVEHDLAVGGSADNTVHIYKLQPSDHLMPKDDIVHVGAITDVAYSPGNAFLGVADANRRVVVYSVPGYHKVHNVDWSSHSARVNCLAWSPNSLYLASGGIDTNVIVWSVRQPNKTIDIKNSHPMSPVTGLVWLNDNQLVSTGQDSNIQTWNITHH